MTSNRNIFAKDIFLIFNIFTRTLEANLYYCFSDFWLRSSKVKLTYIKPNSDEDVSSKLTSVKAHMLSMEKSY